MLYFSFIKKKKKSKSKWKNEIIYQADIFQNQPGFSSIIWSGSTEMWLELKPDNYRLHHRFSSCTWELALTGCLQGKGQSQKKLALIKIFVKTW